MAARRSGKSLMVGLFGFFDRLYRQVSALFGVLHRGLWLGLLGPERVDLATAAYYRTTAPFSDADYNSRGLSKWEQEVVDRFLPAEGRVLVVGAGGGREALALAERVSSVVACECNSSLRDILRERVKSNSLPIEVHAARPSELPAGLTESLADGRNSFDGALVGWGSYMHILGRTRRVDFLRGIGECLPEDGPIILSFLVRPTESRSFRWIAGLGNGLRRLLGGGAPWEVGDTLDQTFDHRFTEAEVRTELEQAGFAVEWFSEDSYPHAVGTKLG